VAPAAYYLPGLRTVLAKADLQDRYDHATKVCQEMMLDKLVDLQLEVVWKRLSKDLALNFPQEARLKAACADDALLRSFDASDPGPASQASDSGHASKRQRRS
jgi:hypothetical protein